MGVSIELGDDVRWQAPTWIWEKIEELALNDELSAALLDSADRAQGVIDLSQGKPDLIGAFGRVLKQIEQKTLDTGPSYFPSTPSFGKFLARLGGLRQALNTALVLRGREEVEDTVTIRR